FVVSNKPDNDVFVKDIHCFTSSDRDEVVSEIAFFLGKNNSKIDRSFLGGEDEIYSLMMKKFFAHTAYKTFKKYCGEHGTASSCGLGIILEEMNKEDLTNRVMVNYWGNSWSFWCVGK